MIKEKREKMRNGTMGKRKTKRKRQRGTGEGERTQKTKFERNKRNYGRKRER